MARELDGRAERDHGVPSLVLMEHAAQGVAAVASLLARAEGQILVLCGPGNNGGDGYGAASILRSWGLSVRLLRLSPRTPTDGDAGYEARRAAEDLAIEDAWADRALLPQALAEADVAVDALFGVGLTRDLEGPYVDWIRALNAAPVLRLAVDVPSGLDADTGVPRPVAVVADVTATMAMPKTGLSASGGGADCAGRVVEIDIGLPASLHRAHLAPGPRNQ